MPTLETSALRQKAVMWAKNSYDANGEVTIDAAVEIDVRWETGNRESQDARGNTIAITSTAFVDRVIEVGSIMWLGAQRDVSDPPTNLRQVVDYDEIPDVKGRKFRRVVSLVKHSDELPTLA